MAIYHNLETKKQIGFEKNNLDDLISRSLNDKFSEWPEIWLTFSAVR